MSFASVVITLLEQSVEKLKHDLKPIEQNVLDAKEGIYITHDGESQIVVYTSRTFKAYIPKKYDGWKVKIVDWVPGEEIQFDLDFNINLED
jgi:hypothetical protein